MVTETAQLLANCYTVEFLTHAPPTMNGNVRKHSYYNHPCSVWARHSFDNFAWLVEHGIGIAEEKLYRFGSRHFSETFIRWCANNFPDNIEDNPATSHSLAIKGYNFTGHYVDVYHQYYVADKQEDKNGKRIDMYSRRKRPEFWFDYIDLAKYPDYKKD